MRKAPQKYPRLLTQSCMCSTLCKGTLSGRTMHTNITMSKKALKQLSVMPPMIGRKLAFWIDEVSHKGLKSIREVPGFNDEALKGVRKGQRSIRLNKAYRAIYVITKGKPTIVEIIEVSKHKY